MSTLAYVIIFSLIGGFLSLAGGLFMLSNKKSANLLMRYSIPFGAGAMLAAAFFDLLPESIEQLTAATASRWVLGGIVLFFLLEHFMHWFHHHHDHAGEVTPAPLVVVGDTIHNFIDGIAIGAAFLVSVPTGIIATIAVATHEVPQEITDFGILVKLGYSKQKVVIINIISSLAAVIGAALSYTLGRAEILPVGVLLAITAGMFIYLSTADLIPMIHEESKKEIKHLAAALLIVGVMVVAGATTIAHKYIDAGHGHGDTVHVDEQGHDHEEDHEHDH